MRTRRKGRANESGRPRYSSRPSARDGGGPRHQLLGHRHHVAAVEVRGVELEHRELGVVHRRDPLVPEVAVDLVDSLEAAHHQPLQVQLRGDAQEQIHPERVVVRDERPRHGPAGDRLHHRGFDLDVAALVEEAPHRAHHRASQHEDAAHLGVREQVEVALAVAGFDVGEPVPLLGRRQQRLREQRQLARLDGELALARAHHDTSDAHEVAEVDEIEEPVGLLTHHVLAHVELQPRLAVADRGERGLAVAALGQDAPGDPDLGRERLELLERACAVGGDHLAQPVAALEARRVGVLAQPACGVGLLQALGRLLGPAGNRWRLFCVAHPIVSGSPRTRLRIASRTPFTNEGESASPKRLASSTASSSTTAAGVCFSSASS